MFDRIFFAYLSLRGQFKGAEPLITGINAMQDKLAEAGKREAYLRRIIDKTQNERDYWYNLWMKMGTEFQAGQSTLMQMIEALHTKAGFELPEPVSMLMKEMNAHTMETFVAPKHPSPAVSTTLETIDDPPKRPKKVHAKVAPSPKPRPTKVRAPQKP